MPRYHQNVKQENQMWKKSYLLHCVCATFVVISSIDIGNLNVSEHLQACKAFG